MCLNRFFSRTVRHSQFLDALAVVNFESNPDVCIRPFLRYTDERPRGVDHELREIPARQHLGVLMDRPDEVRHLQQADGVVTGDDISPLDSRVLSDPHMRLGHIPDVDQGPGKVGTAHPIIATIHGFEHEETAGDRLRSHGRAEDHTWVDNYERPSALEVAHLPRLALGDRLGIPIRKMADAAGLVPTGLGQGLIFHLEDVCVVAIHGNDRRRENNTLDAFDVVGRLKDILGALKRRLDALLQSILDLLRHQERRGDVVNNLTTLHRPVEGSILHEVGFEQREAVGVFGLKVKQWLALGGVLQAADRGGDIVAAFEKQLYYVEADEA